MNSKGKSGNGRRIKSNTDNRPKKFFSKKSELKGWKKPKSTPDREDTDAFRFKKPGSKGKSVKVFKDKDNTGFGLDKEKRTYKGSKQAPFKEKAAYGKDKFKKNNQDKPGVSRYKRNFNTDSNSEFKEKRVYKRGANAANNGQGSSIDTGYKRNLRSEKPSTYKDKRTYTKETKPFTLNTDKLDGAGNSGDNKSRYRSISADKRSYKSAPFKAGAKKANYKMQDDKPAVFGFEKRYRKELPKPKKNKNTAQQDLTDGNNIRLNRYLSNAGVASRREADELIKAGLVSINGKVVTELGSKVKPGDIVKFNNQKLSVEQKIYIVLNKPKDTITTADDPEGRKTIMELFNGEIEERIFAVGRLDRNTTGVILLTNDGELSQRLTHPKYNIKKVYKATLDKNFKPTDMYNLLSNGIELEDGIIKPDALAMPDPKNKNVVGIEIHSGRNRIIHRMFEALGYKVDKLDRALFATLDKLKLKRGQWRHLTEKELKELKRSVNLH